MALTGTESKKYLLPRTFEAGDLQDVMKDVPAATETTLVYNGLTNNFTITFVTPIR